MPDMKWRHADNCPNCNREIEPGDKFFWKREVQVLENGLSQVTFKAAHEICALPDVKEVEKGLKQIRMMIDD